MQVQNSRDWKFIFDVFKFLITTLLTIIIAMKAQSIYKKQKNYDYAFQYCGAIKDTVEEALVNIEDVTLRATASSFGYALNEMFYRKIEALRLKKGNFFQTKEIRSLVDAIDRLDADFDKIRRKVWLLKSRVSGVDAELFAMLTDVEEELSLPSGQHIILDDCLKNKNGELCSKISRWYSFFEKQRRSNFSSILDQTIKLQSQFTHLGLMRKCTHAVVAMLEQP
mgnify:CR=1 FL=1